MQSVDLGWARITHPFHPLRGQSFSVLKARKVAGKDTIVLQGTDRGTFAVPREWTDLADPCPYDPHEQSLPLLSCQCLRELLEVVTHAAGEIEKEGG